MSAQMMQQNAPDGGWTPVMIDAVYARFACVPGHDPMPWPCRSVFQPGCPLCFATATLGSLAWE